LRQPDKNEQIIFTLGTALRREEDFIEIIISFGIEVVVDVRSFPQSRLPHFTRSSLEVLLHANGIDYRFLGRELGGLRKGGYAAYAGTEDFRRAIDLLETVAEGKIPVIICSEHFPWKCHRKWIARELHKRGWLVKHIIDKGKVWTPD
jgi:uncharacterized protein (DUF488 family)